ncbi:MAG: methyl-accepting chemotaxis protein [Spirochaetaceae bacterium]|jgi:methyl-accepting chemotaxis protein|nr:methyl-accepting chemotaxis protein [Spirochaetaceae bacterium]
MKIGVKLIVTISTINIIGIGLLASLTLFEADQEISRLVDEDARNIAEKTGEQIGRWFDEYMDMARGLAQFMEGYKEIPAPQRREQLNFMMKQTLITNPELSDVYANWSPNGLDGMDAEYANAPGADGNGRYTPAWSMGQTGPVVTTIQGFEWDTLMQLPITTDFVFDPFMHPETRLLSAQMCHPVKDNGKIIGLVGDVLALSTIQTLVEKVKPFGDGHAFLFSSGGFVVAHPDPSRLGKNIRDSESDTFGPFLDAMVNAIDTGTAISFLYTPAQSKTATKYYAVPFTIGHDPRAWILAISISYNTIMTPVYRMGLISLIIGILTIIFMSVGVILTARSISRPIAYTMMVLKDVAEGDLTKELAVHSNDELGALVRYLNFTIDKIKHLVLSVRKEAAVLSQTGSDLAANMTETAASINEITANIKSIKSQTNKQAVSAKDAHTIMGQVVENVEMLNSQIQKQIDCVSHSSTAVEQMLANIQSVTQTLVKNKANVSKLAQASEVGRTGLEEVSGDIQEIAKESEGLLEINAVMESIASQTNLLSMNAAIEAAHAGEAGKGFAVVADEIRKLSESSSEQSKTISIVLNKIKESIDKISTATNAVLMNFEAISEGVKTVTNQEMSIRNAMEEQGTGSKVVLESMGSLNEITGEVKRTAHGMISGSREVIKESKSLEQITVEIGDGMQEMASGAEQIDTAVNRINDISIENKKQIGLLMGELQKFKVVSGS